MTEPSLAGKLDALFKSRVHGAINVRGIRYQLLYSLYRGMELYDAATSICVEGIEDLDLKFMVDDEYVQVKSSDTTWTWSQLKDPLRGFLALHRADPHARLKLVFNFEPDRDIERLANLQSLPPNDQSRVLKKFYSLCSQVGASREESRGIAEQLCIESWPEAKVWQNLRRSVAAHFSLGTEAIDTHILVLLAKFLTWAKERRSIERRDLEQVRVEVGQAFARESEFQAYGRGLIDRLSWTEDDRVQDFYDGTGTRPGHIMSGMDVIRSAWLDRIDQVVHTSKVCVIRGASGQGKSALLYRYAHDRWPREHVFFLRVAETPEQVRLTVNYLMTMAGLGLPILLLVDNANWATKQWTSIAREVVTVGVRVLVSTRVEDWNRFALDTTYELVEPNLERQEAAQIYEVFRQGNRIHPSVSSVDWAYEKVGSPPLLLEFVFLITHGEMLRDKLREQIHQFSAHQEDSRAKREILRYVTLAHSLGTPVRLEPLMASIDFQADAQEVLESLVGEYLAVDGDFITGLHWVRSEHLTNLLHSAYPSETVTALKLVDHVPPSSLAAFLASALSRPHVDRQRFLSGLIDQTTSLQVGRLNTYLEGIFEAGERQSLAANQHLFDEAFKEMGSGGVLLLSSELLPIVRPNTIDRLATISGLERISVLREIADRAVPAPRGLDWCREFLELVLPVVAPDDLKSDVGATGVLLDWCHLCGCHLAAWNDIKADFQDLSPHPQIGLREFASFSQGYHRYDQKGYKVWFSRNWNWIQGFLMLHTRSLSLMIEGSDLKVTFLVDDEAGSGHVQTLERLRILRSAVPFCEKYCSEGVWGLPLGLVPSVDETIKHIPRDNLLLDSDLNKNGLWMRLVDERYLPDSYYSHQMAWHSYRLDSLVYVQSLSRALENWLVGKKYDLSKDIEGGLLLVRLDQGSRTLPKPPQQSSSQVKQMFGDGPTSWSSSLHTSISQTLKHLKEPDPKLARLIVHNFKDCVKHLGDLHRAFEVMFSEAPDYFGAASTARQENRFFPQLAELLDLWLLNPPLGRLANVTAYIRRKREAERLKVLCNLRAVFEPLHESGIECLYPTDTFEDHPLKYLPVLFSVDRPWAIETTFTRVLFELVSLDDLADFYYLIPFHNGKRFVHGGYRVGSETVRTLRRGDQPSWETTALQEVPQDVMGLLPYLPFEESTEYELRTKVLGVLAAAQSIRLKMSHMEDLMSSNDPLAQQLHCILVGQIEKSMLRLREQATEARLMLTNWVGECQGAGSDLIDELLSRVIQSSPIGDYEEPDLFETMSTLTHLFDSRSAGG